MIKVDWANIIEELKVLGKALIGLCVYFIFAMGGMWFIEEHATGIWMALGILSWLCILAFIVLIFLNTEWRNEK